MLAKTFGNVAQLLILESASGFETESCQQLPNQRPKLGDPEAVECRDVRAEALADVRKSVKAIRVCH